MNCNAGDCISVTGRGNAITGIVFFAFQASRNVNCVMKISAIARTTITSAL